MCIQSKSGRRPLGAALDILSYGVMYSVRRMKRSQPYLDEDIEDIAQVLSSVSRQEGKTVSELVRECIREKFGRKKTLDKPALAKQISGLWKNRKDLRRTDPFVGRLRKAPARSV